VVKKQHLNGLVESISPNILSNKKILEFFLDTLRVLNPNVNVFGCRLSSPSNVSVIVAANYTICSQRMLDPTFINISNSHDNKLNLTTWVYFGSVEGVERSFPGCVSFPTTLNSRHNFQISKTPLVKLNNRSFNHVKVFVTKALIRSVSNTSSF
jgi:hypothetical protein